MPRGACVTTDVSEDDNDDDTDSDDADDEENGAWWSNVNAGCCVSFTGDEWVVEDGWLSPSKVKATGCFCSSAPHDRAESGADDVGVVHVDVTPEEALVFTPNPKDAAAAAAADDDDEDEDAFVRATLFSDTDRRARVRMDINADDEDDEDVCVVAADVPGTAGDDAEDESAVNEVGGSCMVIPPPPPPPLLLLVVPARLEWGREGGAEGGPLSGSEGEKRNTRWL